MYVECKMNSPQGVPLLFALFVHALIIEREIMKDAFISCWHTFLDAMCPLVITAFTHGLRRLRVIVVFVLFERSGSLAYSEPE